MLQLHLSQFLLTTTGVVVAFVSLPAPLVGPSRDTVLEPIAKQPIHQQVASKSERRQTSQQEKQHTPAASNIGMPYHLIALKGNGQAPAEQFSENLFVSLIDPRGDMKGATESSLSEIALSTAEPVKERVVEEKLPTIGSANRVVVPSIGIDIGVQTGVYDVASASWQVDDGSAFYADTTVPVNDSNGTTLIYGHARWGIFGTLPDVQPGAEATIYTAEGVRFVYTFESMSQVDPSDVSMLTVEGKPKLVLQTCSGLFDQHRTLAFFALKEVERS